jgi:hypothetical protein
VRISVAFDLLTVARPLTNGITIRSSRRHVVEDEKAAGLEQSRDELAPVAGRALEVSRVVEEEIERSWRRLADSPSDGEHLEKPLNFG